MILRNDSYVGGRDETGIPAMRSFTPFKADPDYGRRVAKGLKLDEKEVERLANMSPEERAKVAA